MRNIAAVALLGLALAGPAHAKDMSGRFGIGADSSLGFFNGNTVGAGPAEALVELPGLSVVYRATKIFGLQLIFSTAIDSIGLPGNERATLTQVGVAIRGHIGIALTKDVNLDAVVGFSGFQQTQTIATVNNSSLDFATEVGIRPEWFVTENLSVHTQVGLVITILNEDNGPFADGGVHTNLFGAADLLGNAGFTFYF